MGLRGQIWISEAPGGGVRGGPQRPGFDFGERETETDRVRQRETERDRERDEEQGELANDYLRPCISVCLSVRP